MRFRNIFLFGLLGPIIFLIMYAWATDPERIRTSIGLNNTGSYSVGIEDGNYVIDLKSEITSEFADYKKLHDWLIHLKSTDTVIINFSVNGGGSAYSNTLILNGLDQTPAHTIAKIDGCAMSAAAYISCHAKQIIMGPNSELLFHRAYMYDQGEATEQGSIEEAKSQLQACKSLNVLNDKDIQDVLDGKNVYVIVSEDGKGFKTISDSPVIRNHQTGQVISKGTDAALFGAK